MHYTFQRSTIIFNSRCDMSGTYHLFSLWLLYCTRNVQDNSTFFLITDKLYFVICLYGSIHHIVLLFVKPKIYILTTRLWGFYWKYSHLFQLKWHFNVFWMCIKWSCKWGQMISSKKHHHAVEYLYCNIKCVLVNLTDS